jgi:hypothetical protein
MGILSCGQLQFVGIVELIVSVRSFIEYQSAEADMIDVVVICASVEYLTELYGTFTVTRH